MKELIKHSNKDFYIMRMQNPKYSKIWVVISDKLTSSCAISVTEKSVMEFVGSQFLDLPKNYQELLKQQLDNEKLKINKKYDLNKFLAQYVTENVEK